MQEYYSVYATRCHNRIRWGLRLTGKLIEGTQLHMVAVEGITEDSIFYRLNKRRVDDMEDFIYKGDQVISINGMTTGDEMLQELVEAVAVNITFHKSVMHGNCFTTVSTWIVHGPHSFLHLTPHKS